MSQFSLLDSMLADPYAVTMAGRQAMRIPSMAMDRMEPTPYEMYLQQQQMQQAGQEPEESGGGLLGALGYIGDSLDKFGSRQLRGLLKGRPRELLSFIPFSDALGITDPKDIVSGADLLGTKRQRGAGYRLAEFGAEVFLDPMSLLGPGLFGKALTKSGKAAKASGLLESLPAAGKSLGMGPEVAKGTLNPRQLIDALASAPTGGVPLAGRVQKAQQLKKFREAVAKAEGVDPASLGKDTLDRYLDETLGGVLRIKPIFGEERILGSQKQIQELGGFPVLGKALNKPLKAVTGSGAFPFLESSPVSSALSKTAAGQFALPRLAGRAIDATVGLGSKATRKTLGFAEGVLANPAEAMDSIRQAASGFVPSRAVQAASPAVKQMRSRVTNAPFMPEEVRRPIAVRQLFGGDAEQYGQATAEAVQRDWESMPTPELSIASDKFVKDQLPLLSVTKGQQPKPRPMPEALRDLYNWKNMTMPSSQELEELARQAMKGGPPIPSMASRAGAAKSTAPAAPPAQASRGLVEPIGTDQATRKTFKPRDPSRPLSVRFNLQEGQYKGMWVVEDESTGQRFYYDPEKTSLRMESPLLHNEPSGASKIFDAQKKIDENTAAGVESSKDLLKAARKQAVARVLASKVEALPIESIGDEVSSLLNVGYNPKKAPYWRNTQTGQNIDLTPGKTAITKGRQVFGDFAAPTAPQAPAAAASADSVVQAANLNSEQRENLARNIKRYGLSPEEHGMTQAEVDSLVKAMDERYASRFAKINESPASFSGGTVVRYTLEDGTGLLNRNAWDLSKLTEKEELELPNLLEFGLEQPKDVAADSTFVFTLDGEKKHKRLLSLMKKAARGKVVRTEIEATAKPVWESSDGQLAFSGKPVKEGRKFKFASAAEPVTKPEQPAKAAKSTAKKAQPTVPQKQTVKSLQQYFDFINNTQAAKGTKPASPAAPVSSDLLDLSDSSGQSLRELMRDSHDHWLNRSFSKFKKDKIFEAQTMIESFRSRISQLSKTNPSITKEMEEQAVSEFKQLLQSSVDYDLKLKRF